MQSKNIPYIERIDHLRFFAASVVILFHTFIQHRAQLPLEFLPLINQGHTAVPLFLLLSGIILSLITEGKEIIVSKFYMNRILRIYPLLILVISLGYFVTPDPRPTTIGIDYLMSLLPISNLYRMQYGIFGGHLWSIAVELQLYLLFPFLLRATQLYGTNYIFKLIGFMIVLKIIIFKNYGTVHHLSYFSIFGNLEIFLIGMLTGHFYKNHKATNEWWKNKLVVLIYFLIINLIFYVLFTNHKFFHIDYYGVTIDNICQSFYWIFWPTIQAFMWAGFIIVYLKTKLFKSSAWLALLGRYSYSMYIWHILVLRIVPGNFLNMSPYLLGPFVVLPLTIVFAAISYYVIEQPFLDMRVKYIKHSENK